MKILFTGGGTGGHFYPIIAVAEAIRDEAKEAKILDPKLYYMAPDKYNERALFENEIEFIQVPAGKMRRYFSIQNFTDIFVTLYGCIVALVKMYSLFPDVVFSKGGFASFPPLLAARVLGIPIIIHESDSKPGRVTKWSAKFAKKVALSYPGVAKLIPVKDQDKMAYTGNPVRKDIVIPLSQGAREVLELEEKVPVVVVLGGSQGASRINDVILEALSELVKKYQIIHQTGKNNILEIKQTASIILKDSPYAHRYHPHDFLNELSLRMSAGVADVIVSRAGSTIFEIAAWGVPSIIIPLPESISHDQTSNALIYGNSGSASIIEENNLSSHILLGEINRICDNPAISNTMRERAKAFSRVDSASVIARAILDIAVSHEK